MNRGSLAAAGEGSAGDIESRYAWLRLLACLTLMAIGGSGMYAVTVVLPQVQATFDVSRADASFPYTLTMIGFGVGGVLMGRLSDRYGVMVPVFIGMLGLSSGFMLAGLSGSLWLFALAQGLLIGLLGTSATFAPLVADTSRWFTRRRGIALAICMSGNYVAGAIWPPVMQYFIDGAGWRATYIGVGVFCLLSMGPLMWMLRRRPPPTAALAQAPAPRVLLRPAHWDPQRPLGLSPGMLQALLCVAGVACCVAMAMPQVHIVAYCTDLGFGAARGAEMLAIMLGFGVVSRLLSGWLSDHIGGLRTLLVGSVLQAVALALFLQYDGLVALYIISLLFGLFQGGIVPAYALVVREYFLAEEAGLRVGTVLMATLLGMALGGWLSGAIFDWTGSYHAAFINGVLWNLLNIAIIGFLLMRAGGLPRRGRRVGTATVDQPDARAA